MSSPVSSVAGDVELVRLKLERAVLTRLNRGYGFAATGPLLETYFHSTSLRERLGADPLRPTDTHAAALESVEAEIVLAEGAGAASSLAALGSRLGFNELELVIVAAAIAHALDADVRALAATLSGLTRPVLTAAVLGELTAEDSLAIATALHSRGALRRHRAIVARNGVGQAAEVSATSDLLAAIAGDARIPARFAALVEPNGDALTLLPIEARERVEVVVGLIRAATLSPAVIFRGPQGSGKQAIARTLSEMLERELLCVNATSLGEDSHLEDVMAFARLHGRLLYIAGVETIESAAIVRAIDEHDDLILLATRESGISTLRLSRPTHFVSAPRPTLEVRVAAWRDGLAGIDEIPLEEAETLAARYVIGTGAIGEVLGDASRYARAAGESLATEHLEDAISRRLSLNLGVLGQRITRRASFDEMVLPDDVIDTLRDLIAMVEGRSQILETWGYEKHLGLSRGVSALFSGGPGTGKTMAASVVSSELGLELFRIDLSSVVSKWVGETEKNLARIFDEAQDAHAMLLFDEADSLFGKRTDVQSASDRYANLEVNYVLQRMEQFDGISVLTTNLESGIDAAFMRRLNFRIRFPDPEAEERAELWRKLLPPQAGLADIDVTDLAERFEMTGGHIRNAIVRAAVVASREGRAMRQDDLLRGAHHEYYELGKVMHSSL